MPSPAVDKIRFNSVSKTFDNSAESTQALQDISFGVRAGEFVTLLGPSGCGKTTILNLIARFIKPTAGEVLVSGKKLTTDLRLGMVFQEDATFPWMSVRQNLAYSLKAQDTDAVSEYLQLLGLSDFADEFPSKLSGGMRKRVELGRAYVREPDLLLLDEPFGSLDAITKQDMHVLLHKIWQARKKSVVFVTHDIEEAIFLSNRVLVMSRRPGKVKSEFHIPFEMPRNANVKFCDSFVALRREIMSKLETSHDSSE